MDTKGTITTMPQLRFVRALVMVALCQMLTACFFVPGQYHSTLDLRADGSFAYTYAGEIIFASFEDRPLEQWSDDMAQCFLLEHGEYQCSSDEVAKQREAWQLSQDQQRMEMEELSKIIGFNPQDEAANHKIAERMMQVEGWRQVTYMGEGVFEVDYKISGKLDHELVFPSMPDAELVWPFVIARRINDPAGGKDALIEVKAPGLGGNSLRMALAGTGGITQLPDVVQRTKGTFAITMEGEPVSHNGKFQALDATVLTLPCNKLKVLGWTTLGTEGPAPAATIRLSNPCVKGS